MSRFHLLSVEAIQSINRKSTRDLLAHIFARFVPAASICLEFDWFTALSVSFVIGQNDLFGLGFKTLN